MNDRLTEVIATCDNESIYGTASALLKIRDELEKSGEIKNPDALDYFAKTKLESLILTKLGKYEDLDKEFDYQLLILTKALKQGYIWVTLAGTFEKLNNISLAYDDYNKCFVICGYGMKYYFREYGRTWTLTEEEWRNRLWQTIK